MAENIMRGTCKTNMCLHHLFNANGLKGKTSINPIWNVLLQSQMVLFSTAEYLDGLQTGQVL